MRKFTLVLTLFAVIALQFNLAAPKAAAQAEWLNLTNVNKGVIGVQYAVKKNIKTKVMIVRGADKYTYNLTANQEEMFPLQLGNGEYTITLLENTTGNQYKVAGRETVTVKLADAKNVFLNSIQNVNWTPSSTAIVKAKEITEQKKTDADKVKAVYEYIINNVKYDKKLAANVTTDYIPQIDKTFETNKDICYGYAALTAAMLRSLDIPTKLVMGTTDQLDVYHAWNEVYLNGKWVIIDTTIDAGLNNGTKTFKMIKNSNQYKMEKQY
ncbi:transglutaminase domain-containing protein [Paenibacillaceae bacterium]|nr:transglutaminase domain-containing protein [Paenibacillaceae bacterium]